MSLACDIAVDNPATGAELLRLWNALSDGAQQAIQAAGSGIIWYGNTVYDWEVDTWKNVANEIKSWLDDNHAPVTGLGQVNVTNADGYIGFTSNTYFTMTFPPGATQATFILPSSVFWAWDHVDPVVIPSYGSFSDFSESSVGHGAVNAYMLKSSTGLSVFTWRPDNFGYDLSGCNFVPASWNYGSGYGYRLVASGRDLYPADFCSYSSLYYSFLNGHGYRITSISGGGYAFVSQTDGSYFNNLIFSSEYLAQNWFLNSCGLYTNTTTPETAQVYTDQTGGDGVITYDPDTTQAVIDNIGDHVIDDTLPMVIPGSDAQLKDIADNPELVWDVAAVDVYSGSISLPTVSPNAWYNKFPFCIPFDVIHLFTSFSAEAEAPSFHVLVLPANSFGFRNDDIYWDFDFADYDILVKIVRIFLAAGFVLWLVVITRKLIGS